MAYNVGLNKVTGTGKQAIDALKNSVFNVSNTISTWQGKNFNKVIEIPVTVNSEGEISGTFSIPKEIKNFRLKATHPSGGFNIEFVHEPTFGTSSEASLYLITLLEAEYDSITLIATQGTATIVSLTNDDLRAEYSGGGEPGTTGYIKIYY